MSRRFLAIALSACLTAATVGLSCNDASAGAPPPPVIVGGTSAGAGVWFAGGIVGLATFLGIYDLIRRTSCSGDFFHLGGPGFTTPITPGASALMPKCHKGH